MRLHEQGLLIEGRFLQNLLPFFLAQLLGRLLHWFPFSEIIPALAVHAAFLSAIGSVISAMKRSPWIERRKVPPIVSVRERAMLRPRPDPSECRELSPLTKRSMSSSGSIFSCSLLVFFSEIVIIPGISSRLEKYDLVPG